MRLLSSLAASTVRRIFRRTLFALILTIAHQVIIAHEARDPFRDPFKKHVYERVSPFVADGIFVADRFCLAWNRNHLIASDDHGVTWSQPWTEAEGIRQAVVAHGGRIYLCTQTGTVMDQSGKPINAALGVGTVGKIVVDRQQNLYLESLQTVTAVSIDGHRRTQNGRISVILEHGVVVQQDRDTYMLLQPTTTTQLRHHIFARPVLPSNIVGTGYQYMRDSETRRYAVDGETLVSHDMFPNAKTISWGASADGAASVTTLRDDAGYAIIVESVRQKHRKEFPLAPELGNHGSPPASIVGVAGIHVPNNGRRRFLIAATSGLFIFQP